jgi:hypothetical protein
MGGSGQANRKRRRWEGQGVRRLGLVAGLAAVLLLGVASAASASSFNWYGEGNSTCWQTGQPGSSSSSCDSVGENYLPGHMSEGGIGTDITLASSGDYCAYYRLGDQLSSPYSGNEGSNTGFTTPTPYQNWQEGDSHENVCQAVGSHWGQEARNSAPGNGCTVTCGMHHYVSLRSQGQNDQPWNSAFVEPRLVVHAEEDPQKFTGSGAFGGWGYVCPELEDKTTGNILEYCMQEWRGSQNQSQWQNERIGSCASASGHNIDTVNTFFWPGTAFVTKTGSSENTYVWGGAGGHHFEAEITKANLENAINRDRTEYVQGERPGEPASGKGCGRPLSTNPENYALIGIEQGREGWSGVTELAGNSANLQARTEFNGYKPPMVSTSAASGIQQTQATLNGSVTPNGTDTHYYFEYGTSTKYGSSTPREDAGSGQTSINEHSNLSSLEPGTTYHYRLVAENAGGTEKGGDQTFTTRQLEANSGWFVQNLGTGEQWVYRQLSNGVEGDYWNQAAGTWSAFGHWGVGQATAATKPAVLLDPASDNMWVYYQLTNGGVQGLYWNQAAGEWSAFTLGGSATPNSSPAVVRNATTGDQWVISQLSTGVEGAYWNQAFGKWSSFGHWGGGQATADSRPAVLLDPATDNMWVYYQMSKGVQGLFWNQETGKWSEFTLGGGEATTDSSPSAVRDPVTGDQWIYYQMSNGVQGEYWNQAAGTWTSFTHGGGKATAGSSPTVILDPVNHHDQWIYYQLSKGVQGLYWNQTTGQWSEFTLGGGEATAGGSPVALRDPITRNQWVYYPLSGGIQGSFWNQEAGKWSEFTP